MDPGSGNEVEDVVYISPFSSRSSILLRLHFYACFIAASFYIPSHGGRVLKAADTAFRFHVSITTVEIWKTVYQLFTARMPGEPMGLDLFYNTRVVLLGLFFHTTQIVRLGRYEARTHNGAASQNHRLDCYFASGLFITGLVGVIAHSMQRGAAEKSLLADGSSCAGQHGHLVKRYFLLGITDMPLLRALRPIANVSYLYMDFFYACLQYRAFLGRPKSNREGNDDPHPWRPAIWLSLGHWRHAAIIRTCLLPEMYYYGMVDIGADLHVGTLSHWIIWGITASYVAAETGISYFRTPEETGEKPLI